MDSAHRDKSDRDRRLTDEIARNANIELDLKALTRQLAKSKEEIESFRSKWDDAQARILVLETENHTLHDQLKQKEQTVLDSHQTLSSKYVILFIQSEGSVVADTKRLSGQTAR